MVRSGLGKPLEFPEQVVYSPHALRHVQPRQTQKAVLFAKKNCQNLHAPVSTDSHGSRHSRRMKLNDTERLKASTERHFTLLHSQWPPSPLQVLRRLRYQINRQNLQHNTISYSKRFCLQWRDLPLQHLEGHPTSKNTDGWYGDLTGARRKWLHMFQSSSCHHCSGLSSSLGVANPEWFDILIPDCQVIC